MAQHRLVDDVLGHLSRRIDDDTLLVRCRGPQERGLRFTTPADIRLVTADGHFVDDGPTDGWSPPAELPIHTSVLAARPDLVSVVHAHPRPIVALTLAGVELQPIVGAFDIPATRLAQAGVPVHPRSVLINNGELAAEMLHSMAHHDVCLLRGHGLVAGGISVAQAVLRAMQLDSLARLTLEVLQAGGEPTPIPDADLAQLPDLGQGFNETLLWRHHVATLKADV